MTEQRESLQIYGGCSGGMSRNWRRIFRSSPPWEFCCYLHDQPYAAGGTAAERLEADKRLRQCVADHGHPGWAWAMYWAVRAGGVPWLPLPWRWGFDTDRRTYHPEAQEGET